MDLLLESASLKETPIGTFGFSFVFYIKVKSMKKKSVINNTSVCQVRVQAISDTMSILSGKWKFHILGTLIEGDKLDLWI